MNSRNPFGVGLKKPLSLANQSSWSQTFDDAVAYLSKLKDVNGFPILRHRRKTFVIGFILASRSMNVLASELLTDHGFRYVLTYKMSQDHLELLFACIRGKNGFNNNPDVIQLKSSLRKILMRNAIAGSKYGNCQTFDSDSVGSVFSLNWKRKRYEAVDEQSLEEGENERIYEMVNRLASGELSYYQNEIVEYIAGQ